MAMSLSGIPTALKVGKRTTSAKAKERSSTSTAQPLPKSAKPAKPKTMKAKGKSSY